jgi:hypothetical protein
MVWAFYALQGHIVNAGQIALASLERRAAEAALSRIL